MARDGTLLDDFGIARTPRALHVCNAPSPAATASLALASHLVDTAEGGLPCIHRPGDGLTTPRR